MLVPLGAGPVRGAGRQPRAPRRHRRRREIGPWPYRFRRLGRPSGPCVGAVEPQGRRGRAEHHAGPARHRRGGGRRVAVRGDEVVLRRGHPFQHRLEDVAHAGVVRELEGPRASPARAAARASRAAPSTGPNASAERMTLPLGARRAGRYCCRSGPTRPCAVWAARAARSPRGPGRSGRAPARSALDLCLATTLDQTAASLVRRFLVGESTVMRGPASTCSSMKLPPAGVYGAPPKARFHGSSLPSGAPSSAATTLSPCSMLRVLPVPGSGAGCR